MTVKLLEIKEVIYNSNGSNKSFVTKISSKICINTSICVMVDLKPNFSTFSLKKPKIQEHLYVKAVIST